jgi:hypothetical protein
MREVDTSRIWREVVAGAEMAGRKRRYWQLRGRFDDDAIRPIGADRSAVELVIEADVKQLSSATTPDWLVSAARNHDAVLSACEV